MLTLFQLKTRKKHQPTVTIPIKPGIKIEYLKIFHTDFFVATYIHIKGVEIFIKKYAQSMPRCRHL